MKEKIKKDVEPKKKIEECRDISKVKENIVRKKVLNKKESGIREIKEMWRNKDNENVQDSKKKEESIVQSLAEMFGRTVKKEKEARLKKEMEKERDKKKQVVREKVLRYEIENIEDEKSARSRVTKFEKNHISEKKQILEKIRFLKKIIFL